MKRIEADVSDGKLKECPLCRSTNLRHDDYSKHILIGEYEADNAWFTVTCKDCGLHLHKKDLGITYLTPLERKIDE